MGIGNGSRPNAIGSMASIFAGGSNPLAVIGPGASTDNAVVRWDGVTGTQVQDTATWTYDGVSQTINTATFAAEWIECW